MYLYFIYYIPSALVLPFSILNYIPVPIFYILYTLSQIHYQCHTDQSPDTLPMSHRPVTRYITNVTDQSPDTLPMSHRPVTRYITNVTQTSHQIHYQYHTNQSPDTLPMSHRPVTRYITNVTQTSHQIHYQCHTDQSPDTLPMSHRPVTQMCDSTQSRKWPIIMIILKILLYLNLLKCAHHSYIYLM